MHSFICPDCHTETKFKKNGLIIHCAGCKQYFKAACLTGLDKVFFKKISETTAKNGGTFDASAIFVFLQQFPEIRDFWLVHGKKSLLEGSYKQALALFSNVKTGEPRHEEANNLLLGEYLRSHEYKLAADQIYFMLQNCVDFLDLGDIVAQIIDWGEKVHNENLDFIEPLRTYARTKIAPLGSNEKYLQSLLPKFEELHYVLTICVRLIDGVDVLSGTRLNQLLDITHSIVVI